MKIILIAPSGAVSTAFEQLPLQESDDTLVLSRVLPDAGDRSLVLTPSLSRATDWAERTLGGSVIGRNVLRLTVLDAGRRFAGATRRSRSLRPEFDGADLIVVLERNGLLAGWHASRGPARRARVVYGIPAARGVISESRVP
ncbi:hypothetical protein ACI7YT_06255 [Microbacterium sp. M]|uniref:hypothetical protein n=1 Tax=Microbacterium sp. M TaxID=3377125 RepID=UPI003863B892